MDLLVTEKSATSVGITAQAKENNHSLNTNHRGLVKFESRNQDNYDIVSANLVPLIEQARECMYIQSSIQVL